jgi:hypothetical protein
MNRSRGLRAVTAGLLVLASAIAPVVLPGSSLPAATASTPDLTAFAIGDVYDANDGATSASIIGDTWINSWASDGSSYVTSDDGNGFNSIEGQRYSLRGIGQFAGDPNYNTATFAGSNLSDGTLGTSRTVYNHPLGNFTYGYHRGVYEQNGVLYDGVDNFGDSSSTYSALIKSSDGGVNWTNQFGAQNSIGSGFDTSSATSMFSSTARVSTDENFVKYGRGQDVPLPNDATTDLDTYVYMVMFYNLLARVPRASLPNLNASDYQWFTGTSGGVPAWSSSESAAQPMSDLYSYPAEDTTKPISSGNIVYNYGLGKYLVMGYGAYWPNGETRSWVDWGAGLPSYHLYTSDSVWGPWTDSGSSSLAGSTVWEYLLSNKYTSTDGQKMWVATSGGGLSGFCGTTSCLSHQPWHYGLQYMPVYMSTGTISTYYASDASLAGGVSTATSYPDYHSTGYATGWPATGSNSSTATETFTLNKSSIANGSAGAGWHIISIRYANTATAGGLNHNGNTMSVYVNAGKARVVKLAAQNSDNTGAPAWTNASYIYYLPSGTTNTVTLRCDNGDVCNGVNIDSIQVSAQPTYDEGSRLNSTATVTASSTTTGSAAANAAKGYLDFGQNEWTAASTDTHPSLTYSWSTPQRVNKVLLYDKEGATNQVTSGQLTLTDAAGKTTTVAVGSLQNDGEAGAVVTFPMKVVTSVTFTVGATASGTSNVGLGEMDVYDTLEIAEAADVSAPNSASVTPSTNLAYNRPAMASSTFSGFPVTNALDASSSSVWAAGTTFPQSICVDLGTPQALGTVQFDTTESTAIESRNRNTTYTIDASNDSHACDSSKVTSGAWTTGNWARLVTHGSGNPGVANGLSYMTDTVAGTYRYVELTLNTVDDVNPGNDWPSIAEFEVYPPAVEATNLALNQTTNASSTYSTTHLVDVADGSKDTVWAAASTFPQSVCVDLGSARPLGAISWDASDPMDGTARTTSYKLTASNDSAACDTSKLGSGAWTSGTWATLRDHTGSSTVGATGYDYMTDTVSGSYRYVQLTISDVQYPAHVDDQWPSIADFQVFAATTQATPYLNTVALSMFDNNSITNGFNGSVGYQFTPADNVTVTDLGRYYYPGDASGDSGGHPANTGSHAVSLYDASSPSSPLATASVQMAAGTQDRNGFEYAPLSTAVNLTAGHSYYLMSAETNGGDYWWGYPALPVLGASSGRVTNGVYLDTSVHVWPSLNYGPVGYGPVSFLYHVTSTSP